MLGLSAYTSEDIVVYKSKNINSNISFYFDYIKEVQSVAKAVAFSLIRDAAVPTFLGISYLPSFFFFFFFKPTHIKIISTVLVFRCYYIKKYVLDLYLGRIQSMSTRPN